VILERERFVVEVKPHPRKFDAFLRDVSEIDTAS
jgi:hypothetical protein